MLTRHLIFIPLLVLILWGGSPIHGISQPYKSSLSKAYIQKTLEERYTPDYLICKNILLKAHQGILPGRFGEFVPGVCASFKCDKKQIAFTFDACIGQTDDYNEALIELLRREKIPATLFVTGSWIDSNLDIVRQLAADSLFELENHGLFHRVCSINGRTAYNILPTQSLGDVIDEMELNAIRLEQVTGHRPHFFRSSTAYLDEASVSIARELGMKVVNYDILSGDAIPFAPAQTISDNIIKHAHPGAIVIMHFNHPKWHEREALEKAIPILRAMGYTIVRLDQVNLVEKK